MIVLRIEPDGDVKTLYTEDIDLRALGALHVERASHVEYDNALGGWVVFGPDGSGIMLDQVFESRADALAAEVAHLQATL